MYPGTRRQRWPADEAPKEPVGKEVTKDQESSDRTDATQDEKRTSLLKRVYGAVIKKGATSVRGG